MIARVQMDFPRLAGTIPRSSSRRPMRPGPIAWLRGAAVRWRERRTLEELDDRMLHDIGLSRSQAIAEAAKPFWRR
jgi:uncharacterized protein YjiS (DUF1127 family)